MKNLFILLFVIGSIQFFAGCGGDKDSSSVKLSSYRGYLESLHKSELASISKSLNEYRKDFTSTAPEIRDSAFIDFRSFYYNVINSYYELFFNNQDLVNKLNENKNDDPKVLQLKKDLDQNGLRLSKTEGGYYIDEQPNYLYDSFKSYVSPAIRDYLMLRSKELEEGFSENSKLLITFQSVGDRIVNWENYLAKYPSSPLAAEAKFSFHLYLNTFLTGLDNSPIANDDILLPEMKEVYTNYFQKNNNLESSKIVEKYYAILSKNNFQLTSDLDTFYEENQIESMKGMEPPTR